MLNAAEPHRVRCLRRRIPFWLHPANLCLLLSEMPDRFGPSQYQVRSRPNSCNWRQGPGWPDYPTLPQVRCYCEPRTRANPNRCPCSLAYWPSSNSVRHPDHNGLRSRCPKQPSCESRWSFYLPGSWIDWPGHHKGDSVWCLALQQRSPWTVHPSPLVRRARVRCGRRHCPCR